MVFIIIIPKMLINKRMTYTYVICVVSTNYKRKIPISTIVLIRLHYFKEKRLKLVKGAPLSTPYLIDETYILI